MVKLLEDKELATIRSALGRRRSKRKVLEHPHEEVLQQPFAGFPGDQRRVPSDAKLRSSLSLLSASFCSSSLSHRVVVCASDARILDQALQPQTDHLACSREICN